MALYEWYFEALTKNFFIDKKKKMIYSTVEQQVDKNEIRNYASAFLEHPT